MIVSTIGRCRRVESACCLHPVRQPVHGGRRFVVNLECVERERRRVVVAGAFGIRARFGDCAWFDVRHVLDMREVVFLIYVKVQSVPASR